MTMTEWMKAERLRRERWEDEGGATVGIDVPLPPGGFVGPLPKTAELQDLPRHGNRKFIIEAIQPATALAASKRNVASKE